MTKTINQKLHIFWLHTHFLYWMGGTKFIYELIKVFKPKYKVTVIVENASKIAITNYKNLGVELVSLNTSTSTSVLYWLMFPLYLYLDKVRILNIIQTSLRSDESGIIISNMFPMNYVANYVGGILSLKHVQYCFEPFAFFHDKEFINNFDALKRFFISILAYFYKTIDITATACADVVITLNHTTAKYIKEIYSVNPVISYAGIDIDHFKPYTNQVLSNKYRDYKIIIHSTDYSPVKNTDLMIKIFAKVKERIPEARLLITSTIDNQGAQISLRHIADILGVTDSIEFLGFVDYQVLPQLYSLAYVLVQCSHSERSGTTSMALPVKEAMACGTPAIRYPVKGEDVIDNKSGFLVDPRDESKMVARIVTLLTMSKEIRRLFSNVARKAIVSKFSWDKTAEVIENVFYNTKI